VNKSDLINVIASEVNLPKRAAARVLDSLRDIIIESLKRGERIRIRGIGTFSVTDAQQPENGPRAKPRAAISRRTPKTFGVFVFTPRHNPKPTAAPIETRTKSDTVELFHNEMVTHSYTQLVQLYGKANVGTEQIQDVDLRLIWW